MEALGPPTITSSSNPSLKRIRKLRSRKHREQEGAFYVEGIQTVWQAVRNGADIEAILIAPGLLRSDRAARMVMEQQSLGTTVISVGNGAFSKLTDRDNPSGLAAVVRSRAPTLDRLDVGPGSVFVALDRAEKPGNVGSIIRSVDGAGGQGVIVIGDSTDPYHPTAVKASMGTLFSLPVTSVETLDELTLWAASHNLQVVGTSAHAEHIYWEVRYGPPVVLLFGNEGTGLGPSVLEKIDSVRIPMSGSATSLNLAVAVGVLLYEVRRQQTQN